MSTPTIECVRTTGSLETATGPVTIENNVWLLGNDDEVIIIDAAHDSGSIVDAVRGRTVRSILLTHGHEDHINVALDVSDAVDAELFLHPADHFLWDATHPERRPNHLLAEGDTSTVAGTALRTVHTPGHTPGSVCFVSDALGIVLSGDTLFEGGPGATRWEYSSFPEIIASIERSLLTLDGATHVLPGHGASTTVAAERSQMPAYIERGW